MTTSTPVTPVVATKPWYTSKTVWLNVASFLIMVAALFTSGGTYANLLPAQDVTYIGVAVAIINVILRVWFTTTAVG